MYARPLRSPPDPDLMPMPSESRPYLTTLTPLRGIAALLVVVFHSNLMLMAFLPPGYTHVVENGWLWVDFFFMLSGFIMSYVYGKRFAARAGSVEYWRYLGARFARVYPLHLVTLVWALASCVAIVHYATALDPFFADMFNPRAAPASLLLLQGLHLFKAAPLNTPSWSLSTEWWVYMIFPFVVPTFSRLNVAGRRAATVLLIGFYVLLRYWIGPMAGPVYGQPTLNMVQDFGIFRCLAGFFLGMLVYEFYRSGIARDLFRKSGCFVAAFGGCLLAMHLGAMDLAIVTFFPFILLTAAYNEAGVKQLLDSHSLQRLGDWSFSIYMVHVPIMLMYVVVQVREKPDRFADFMTLVSTPPDYRLGAILCVIVVVLTLLVAALTYRFVELPARNYLNARFATKRNALPVAARMLHTGEREREGAASPYRAHERQIATHATRQIPADREP